MHMLLHVHHGTASSDMQDRSLDGLPLRCKEKEKSITKVEQVMVDCAVDKYIRDPAVPVT